MSDDEPRKVGLEHIMQLAVELATSSVRGWEPGKVTAYDETRQAVSVQLLVRKAHVDDTGERVIVTEPEIHSVPVWMFGPARGRVTVPVAVGDVGIVLFSSVSLERWKFRGGVVDPDDARQHDVNDCFFIPGGHDFAHVPTPAPTTAIVIHGDNRLGGPTGTEKLVKATTWESGFDLVVAAIVAALDGIAPGAGTPVDTAWTTFKGTAYKTLKTEAK